MPRHAPPRPWLLGLLVLVPFLRADLIAPPPDAPGGSTSGPAALLGLVQGLTEFLPVSSSGHLVLAQNALQTRLDLADQAVLFDLALHLATLLPVMWLYRHTILGVLQGLAGRAPGPKSALKDVAEARRLAMLVIVATIPTGLMGILFEDPLESLFHSPRAVGVALVATGALLFSTRWAKAGERGVAAMGIRDALILGVAQGVAITPGVSRSGTTIAVALFLGLDRALAARFSFLLAIPAIAGAMVLKARDGLSFDALPLSDVALGMTVAAVSGYLALLWLVRLVKRGNFAWFAAYLWPLGLWAMIFA